VKGIIQNPYKTKSNVIYSKKGSLAIESISNAYINISPAPANNQYLIISKKKLLNQ